MIKNKTFLLWWRLKEGGQRSQWYSVLISWDDFVTNLQVKTCFNFLFCFLCAGILLPYPSDNLVLDVVLLLLFLGLETLRIFYGENPNRNTWADRKQLTSDWSVTELHKSVLMRYNSYCTKNAAASVSKHGSCCHVTHKKNLWWHHWWLVMVCGCSGWKGNLCERSLASCVSLFILIPCVALAVYYLLLQTFVLRLEFLLSAVLLCFYSLEFLLGLLSVSAFSRWPDYLMRVGGSQFVKNLYLL